jgi:hypothetical protein
VAASRAARASTTRGRRGAARARPRPRRRHERAHRPSLAQPARGQGGGLARVVRRAVRACRTGAGHADSTPSGGPSSATC